MESFLKSGQQLHSDILVTATGLKLRFAGGIKLTVDNVPYNSSDKFVWNVAMLEDLPNCGFVLGYLDAADTRSGRNCLSHHLYFGADAARPSSGNVALSH